MMDQSNRDNPAYYDVCIVGGGASGLVAAIKIKDSDPLISVVILEKMDVPAKKVAAAGNGRCNLSNIESGDWDETSKFFSSIGLITRVDDSGRIYPYSEDGRDVVRTLLRACEDRGIEILTRRNVVDINTSDGFFFSEAEFNKPKAYRPTPSDGPIVIKSKALLLVSGGKSKPELGTTGDGYRFAKALGHSVNTLIPALTGVETVESPIKEGLSGIRQKGRVSLYRNDTILFQSDGEVQFTDYGISGIVIFDLSRFLEGLDLSSYKIEIDFAPDLSMETLRDIIEEAGNPIDGLCSVIKSPIAKTIRNHAYSSDEPYIQAKRFILSPSKLRGWDMAQVTRGGVPLREIDDTTGESRLVSGLFFAGEIIDKDYRCGGFNLQNAWTTGLRAGAGIVRFLEKKGIR